MTMIEMLWVITAITAIFSVALVVKMLIDWHFEKKWDKVIEARKARQAEIARQMGE